MDSSDRNMADFLDVLSDRLVRPDAAEEGIENRRNNAITAGGASRAAY